MFPATKLEKPAVGKPAKVQFCSTHSFFARNLEQINGAGICMYFFQLVLLVGVDRIWGACVILLSVPSVSLWWRSLRVWFRITQLRYEATYDIHLFARLPEQMDWRLELILIFCYQQEIAQAVEKVCDVLPSSLTAQCKDLIEAYGQAIIELLVQEADPKTICTFLSLCKEASRTFICTCQQCMPAFLSQYSWGSS